MQLPGLIFTLVSLCPAQSTSSPAVQPTAEDPATPSPVQAESKPEFLPPVPGEDDFDWIRLKSGEWLKGEIIGLRKGTLEFDSDELDELNLDIDDIAYARSSRRQVVQVEGREDLEGTLVIDGDLVTIGGAKGGTTQREFLMSIVPGSESWLSAWSGDIGLGYTRRTGNTSQTDFTVNVFLRRRTSATRWDTTYNSTNSETNGERTADTQRLNSRYDYFLTRRLFVTPIAVTGLQDQFTNIDYRVSPSAGIGYDLLDQNTVSWEVDLGLGYQFTKFISVLPGETNHDDTVAAFAGTGVEWDVTPDVEFDVTYQLVMPMPDTNEYTHHALAKLSVDLLGMMDVDLTAIWDRNNAPLADADNQVPKPDDFRITLGVSIDF